MSTPLPTVSGKQMVRALETRGWYIRRVRGSHHILRHPEIPDVLVVPVHGSRALKRGTLLNILKTAGLSREDLRRLL
jgi:predicted RNA binding protein YcfA (HicA-like mRNA interferase family)